MKNNNNNRNRIFESRIENIIQMADTIEATKEEEDTKAVVVVDDVKQEEEPEKEEEAIYQDAIPNRVVVARKHPLSYYVDRARRILRMEEQLYVSGRGNTISMACTLIEVLKRQKIGKVVSISTGLLVEPFFNNVGDARWREPATMITFSVTRDEFAEYVSDYHQRKVVEIFETTDKEKTGRLNFEQIDGLKMGERFQANDEQSESAKEFIAKCKEKSMDLPTFIKYCSLFIHPLLKDKVFKSMLTEFGIKVRGMTDGDDDSPDDKIDDVVEDID